MYFELGRRGQDRSLQPLVLAKPVAHQVAGDVPRARLVVDPQRCLRHARDVGADDELERHQIALAGSYDVRIRHIEQVVRHDVGCPVEPELAIAFRVWPLNGIVPRILSKADCRSVVMIVRTPSAM